MNKTFLLGLMLILVAGLAYAAIPGVGHQFYGDVTVNGAPASDGTIIKAYINGNVVKEDTTSNGEYDFTINDPNNLFIGETVTFYVSGKDSGESETFVTGGSTRVDLGVTVTTTTPPSGSSGGGSGGGGGGGSSTYDDSPDWTCDWSECIDGKQTATCTHNTRIGVSKKDSRDCVEEEATANVVTAAGSGVCVEDWKCNYWSECVSGETSCIGGWVDENNCGTEKELPDDDYTLTCIPRLVSDKEKANGEDAGEKKSGLSAITGAVIGAVGKAPWVYLIVLIVIVGGIIFLTKKKKPKTPKTIIAKPKSNINSRKRKK